MLIILLTNLNQSALIPLIILRRIHLVHFLNITIKILQIMGSAM
jgi:hypothetical protein